MTLAFPEFPNALTTGPRPGTVITPVGPGKDEVSSGTNWEFRGAWVEVNGATTLENYYIPYNLNIATSAEVHVRNCIIETAGDFGISLRGTTGVIIKDCLVLGKDRSAGRVDAAIKDVYGTARGTVVDACNIYWARSAIHLTAGVISKCYIHDPGYVSDDHINGIIDPGSTEELVISGNTILNPLSQTDAIILHPGTGSTQDIANKIIENNLLAGGGYCLYGGQTSGNSFYNCAFVDNYFSQIYYPACGYYGTVAEWNSSGSGTCWAGNEIYETSALVPAP
jgi:Right handed beta helix region